MDSVKSKMNNLIDSMKEQLFEMGDAIYDHPEIGLQEVFASKLLEDWLEKSWFFLWKEDWEACQRHFGLYGRAGHGDLLLDF